MQISIIIPTLNEADNLARLLPFLNENSNNNINEIIVVDGGSTDNTEEIAMQNKVHFIACNKRSRPLQLNLGAQHATANVLYFLHADSIPPKTFTTDVLESITEGYPIGCFRFLFRSERPLLKFNSYCTRFDRIMCRGGDQSLFITRQLFDKLNGYNNHFIVMEDYDIIIRARKFAPFKIIPKNVSVSARKYINNSYLRVNIANLTVFLMFFLKFKPINLMRTYTFLLNHPKV